MIIPQTQNAIKFYELAIKNAQEQLAFQVNQDIEYQKFMDKYNELRIRTIFHSNNQEFNFYSFQGGEPENYFTINNGEVRITGECKEIENLEDVAQELLNIVKKFY